MKIIDLGSSEGKDLHSVEYTDNPSLYAIEREMSPRLKKMLAQIEKDEQALRDCLNGCYLK